MTGSHNDINVLHRSLIFDWLLQCTVPRVNYEMNFNAYDKSYYLSDGSYPYWATLMKIVRKLQIKTRGLLRDNKLIGNIWSEHSVCSKLGGLLFVIKLEHGL
jgi:hypothetical protein